MTLSDASSFHAALATLLPGLESFSPSDPIRIAAESAYYAVFVDRTNVLQLPPNATMLVRGMALGFLYSFMGSQGARIDNE